MSLVNRTIDFIYKNKTILAIINSVIILLFSIVIFRNVIFTNEWPAGGDVMGWISASYSLKDFRWLYVWRQYSFGSVQEIKSIDVLLWLGYSVFRDPAVTIKVFMFGLFVMAGFTMYLLAYHFTRRHLASLSASIIYILNQWIFSQYTEAHLGIIFGYALAPLLFLLLDRALKSGKLRDILLLALASTVFVTGANSLSVLIIGVFLIMFVIFYFLSEVKTNLRCGAKRFLKIAITVGIFFPLLVSFWLIPIISNATPQYISSTFQYPIESTYWTVTHWTYPNISDAFTLRAVESWGYKSMVEVYTGLGLPDFPVYPLLSVVFILAYCTLIIRRNRYTLFFATATLISMIIAKGPSSPFGYLFVWAWFNIPFFAIFRVPSRWAMMIALSHAFFVSLMVSLIERYMEKREHLNIKKVFLRLDTKISESSDAISYYVSSKILNKIIENLHKILYYLMLAILILTLLSGPLASFFFLNHGLQGYTYPQEYMEPYLWIAEQPGDYKVITAGQIPNDFTNVEFTTDLGSGHDLGYESSFIHDKPVLQDGGWSQLPHNFVDHLRDSVVRPQMTGNSLQVLGTLNYKYAVLPPYVNEDTRTFFLNQKGAEIVLNESSIIIENKFFTPLIFSSTENAVVLGGLESFWPLAKIDSFNFSQVPLIFPQWVDESVSVEALLNESDGLVFVDTDVGEMVMLLLSRDENFVKVADYGYPSSNSSGYWIPSAGWRNNGKFVLFGETLSTMGENSINIPFSVPSNDIYDIWMRIAFGPNRGNLAIYIDNIPVEEIQPMSKIWIGPKWVNITRLDLESGNHVMTLKNDGAGYNDVDAIAAIKPDVFQSEMNDLINTLQGFSGRIIQVLEVENNFEFPESWSNDLRPYEGFALHTEGFQNVSPEASANASSVGVWDSSRAEADRANDGNLETRWASEPHAPMPQWLQIEWKTPQELTAAHILFEEAYAEDYLIQTWDGTDWVNQVNVTGNTMLDCLQLFPEAVKTTKLRIYVTSVTALYDLASIWELEAYTTPWISTSLSTPREASYMFALRFVQSSNQRTPYLRVDDKTVSLQPINTTTTGVQWYEGGPVYLNSSNHLIEVGADGKVDFDEMIVYSLKEGESMVSVNSLFEAKSDLQVSYEKINPCKYEAHIENSNEPFMLVFSEAYHPMWKAYIDGEEMSPIPAYSIVNGFYINKTGNFDVTIYFTGQTYADVGLKISMVALIIVGAMLIIPSKKLKHWGKYIKQKIFRENASSHLSKAKGG